jgi:glutamate--cysteine ligase
MSRDLEQSAEVLEDLSQLVDYFKGGEKPSAQRAVGTEHEKLVFRRDDLGLLSYEEPGGSLL